MRSASDPSLVRWSGEWEWIRKIHDKEVQQDNNRDPTWDEVFLADDEMDEHWDWVVTMWSNLYNYLVYWKKNTTKAQAWLNSPKPRGFRAKPSQHTTTLRYLEYLVNNPVLQQHTSASGYSAHEELRRANTELSEHVASIIHGSFRFVIFGNESNKTNTGIIEQPCPSTWNDLATLQQNGWPDFFCSPPQLGQQLFACQFFNLK